MFLKSAWAFASASDYTMWRESMTRSTFYECRYFLRPNRDQLQNILLQGLGFTFPKPEELIAYFTIIYTYTSGRNSRLVMRRKRKQVFVLLLVLLALSIFYTLNKHGHSMYQAIGNLGCDEVRGRKLLHDLVRSAALCSYDGSVVRFYTYTWALFNCFPPTSSASFTRRKEWLEICAKIYAEQAGWWLSNAFRTRMTTWYSLQTGEGKRWFWKRKKCPVMTAGSIHFQVML